MTVAAVKIQAEREHALLSASASERWLHCTPSARLEEHFPESTSEYAEEGRLAHAIAELKLRKAFLEPMGPGKFRSALKKLQTNSLYKDEMLGYTDAYLDYVSGIVHAFSFLPYVAVEKKYFYDSYVPEGFGTVDSTVIGGSVLHVTDFKYGKGVPVSAIDNSQMKLYALGALHMYKLLYDIQTVKLAIVQPRLDNISEFEITAADLYAWGESIKPIAQTAWNGQGDYVPGGHCQFCRAKALCRARSEFNTGMEEFHCLKPPLISDEEVGQILIRAIDLEKWVKHLKEYALSACLAGRSIFGWKAVAGRSDRQFDDTDAAFQALIEAGYEEAVLYERKPITLTSVETLLGKKKFTELLASHVMKPPGKPTLAVENDKREAVTARTNAQDDFKEGVNENE